MAITSGVTVTKLAAEETRRTGFSHAVTIPYSVLVTQGAGNTTATIAILDVFAGDVVTDRCAYAITEAWNDSDGSMNSLTLQVGDGVDPNRFLVETTPQLAEDGTEVDYFISLAGGAPATSTAPYAYTTTDTVDALFTCAGGANPTMAEWTSGSVTIFLQVFSLSKLVTGIQ